MITKYEMLPNEHWWGGTTIHAYCPLTKNSDYHKDFTFDPENQTSPFFVSDFGRYIWSDEPFKVDIENGVFTFEGGEVTLTQAGDSLKEAFLDAARKHFPSDGVKLQSKFFTTAQYNTWMEFTYYPTQEGVLKYAREWVKRGFKPGVFMIDEGWHQHTAYGNWEFDFARFPNPKEMVDELHQLGYSVMLWVVPFVTPVGPKYVRSLRPLVGTDPEMAKHVYLRTANGEVALTKWWNGASAILDMREPYNQKYLDDQLQHLIKDYGIDGFKFDGGCVRHFASDNIINGELPEGHDPYACNVAWNEFGRRYPFHEYKDTYNGGGKNVIERLHDRKHSWTDNGINEIIPCAIVNGLLGNPFTCPDMVGGGEWSNRFTPGFQTDEELFVRMAQASALFPMIQFSWAPWLALKEENVLLCKKAAELHVAIADDLMKIVEESEKTGEPVLRSLEYYDPHKGYAEVEDEFLLGEKFLSAPIVTPNTYERKVFFPKGRWMDEDGNIFEGNTEAVLKAPIEKLLWFKNIA